jgi:hypothetical protein
LDSEFRESYGDLLYSIGSTFPDFVVGFLPPHLFSIAENAVGSPIAEFPAFLVFSVRPRSFCPPLHGRLDESSISDYLNAILNESVRPEYHSEEIPENGENGAVQKLVGKTYAEFMNGMGNDTLVLYLDSLVTEESVAALEEFGKAAADLVPFGLSAAFIDVSANSAALPFPPMLFTPHLRLFWGAGEERNSMAFMHTFSRQNIVQFVQRLGTGRYAISVGRKSLAELKKELRECRAVFGRLPEEDQEPLSEYFRILSIELGLV